MPPAEPLHLHGITAMPTVSRPNAVPSNRCASDAAPMQRLAECQSEFLRFLRRRMSCPDDAEDAFQDFCVRSEEHTSELQSLMRISYAVFCLKKKKIQ